MKPAKIIFMATADFAVPILKKLLKTKYNIQAVYTKPDKPKGRGLKKNPSPIKQFVKKYQPNLKIFEPVDFSQEQEIQNLKNLKPDLIIVVAYGIILPEMVLKIPEFGCINVHPSLLPKYRGPSPIQTVILNGDRNTGTTIIKLNAQMDAGDIIARRKIKLSSNINSQRLHAQLSRISAKLLTKILPVYISKRIKLKKQNPQKATYTKIIKKSDGAINWNQPAKKIEQMIRAFYPWPKAFTYFSSKEKNKQIKIDIIEAYCLAYPHKYPAGKVFLIESKNSLPAVATPEGVLVLERIFPAGKKEMTVSDFINGNQDFIGTTLK